MEASIGGNNIKTFVRILQCASRFGDELCMHANKDVWELATTNSSRSAFFLVKLRPRTSPSSGDGFFSRYKAVGSPVQQRRGVKCALLVKSVLAVLGKASSSSTSNVDRLDLKIIAPTGQPARRRNGRANGGDEGEYEDDEEEETGLSHRLEIKLVCKHGVTKRHSLHLGSSEFLRAEVDPNSTPSSFTVPARTLRDWLDHFSAAIRPSTSTSGSAPRPETQLGWHFGKGEVRVKSWEGSTKELSTEIRLDREEFTSYWVEDERVELTLPMKEFRAMLQLADTLSIDLTAAFSEAGQPFTLTSDPKNEEVETFDIFCAIATTTCDAFGADDGETSVKPRRTTSEPQRGRSESNASRIGSSRTGTGPGNGADLGRGSEQPADGSRKRKASEAPPSRSKARLDFSQNGHGQPNAVLASFHIQAPGAEPLFFPASSQWDGGAGPSQSQGGRRPLTQQELLEISGMGDMDALLNDLDQAEEEEWAASQAEQGHDRTDGPSGAAERGDARAGPGDAEETMETMEASRPAASGEDTLGGMDTSETARQMFEEDPSIFGAPAGDASRLGLGLAANGTAIVLPGEETANTPHVGALEDDGHDTEPDIEDGAGDEGGANAALPTQGDGEDISFSSFFGD